MTCLCGTWERGWDSVLVCLMVPLGQYPNASVDWRSLQHFSFAVVVQCRQKGPPTSQTVVLVLLLFVCLPGSSTFQCASYDWLVFSSSNRVEVLERCFSFILKILTRYRTKKYYYCAIAFLLLWIDGAHYASSNESRVHWWGSNWLSQQYQSKKVVSSLTSICMIMPAWCIALYRVFLCLFSGGVPVVMPKVHDHCTVWLIIASPRAGSRNRSRVWRRWQRILHSIKVQLTKFEYLNCLIYLQAKGQEGKKQNSSEEQGMDYSQENQKTKTGKVSGCSALVTSTQHYTEMCGLIQNILVEKEDIDFEITDTKILFQYYLQFPVDNTHWLRQLVH